MQGVAPAGPSPEEAHQAPENSKAANSEPESAEPQSLKDCMGHCQQ